MFLRVLLLLMFLSAFETRHVVTKRGGNAYGDELVMPSGGAPKTAPLPEQPPAVVSQPPPAEETKVVESGYRA
ncbi:hypothetical protein OESDEN_09493 [Oesophagostomum dentatum]|uniref:Secreted protein n=1 Tax=Oesophagostomum dentatum TaxID=61180 RepID=A0A0B1T5M9_OESDE|nr:hypothetical protein OESDEN_09493 [Oesophagostomum dentatum]